MWRSGSSFADAQHISDDHQARVIGGAAALVGQFPEAVRLIYGSADE